MNIDTLKDNPRTLTLDKEKRFRIGFYQTSDSLATKKYRILGKIDIDVQLDQVQIDVFSEYNYISSSISLELIGADKFKEISSFEVDDMHFTGVNQIYTARNAIRLIGTGNVLTKGKYTLLIKRGDYSKELMQTFTDNEISQKLIQNVKFPFTIRVESEPVSETLQTQNAQLRLIDIEYNGDPDDEGKTISTDTDLTVLLEFNDDLDTTDISIQFLALLVLDKSFHEGVSKSQKTIEPITVNKSLSSNSQNSIQLIFPGKSLKKGAKYTLQLDSKIGINQELIDADAFTILTSTSSCNPKGVFDLNQNPNGVCTCKYPYMGPTCEECQDEYVFNSSLKECILFET